MKCVYSKTVVVSNIIITACTKVCDLFHGHLLMKYSTVHACCVRMYTCIYTPAMFRQSILIASHACTYVALPSCLTA